MYVCMYVCMFSTLKSNGPIKYIPLYVCIYFSLTKTLKFMYVCMYVCMYVTEHGLVAKKTLRMYGGGVVAISTFLQVEVPDCR